MGGVGWHCLDNVGPNVNRDRVVNKNGGLLNPRFILLRGKLDQSFFALRRW